MKSLESDAAVNEHLAAVMRDYRWSFSWRAAYADPNAIDAEDNAWTMRWSRTG